MRPISSTSLTGTILAKFESQRIIMNKLIYHLVLLFILCSNLANSQTIYKQPEALKLFENEIDQKGRFFDSTIIGTTDGSSYFYKQLDGFYPIGWSRDGKLAYITRWGAFETEYFPHRLYIKDLIIDSIIVECNINAINDPKFFLHEVRINQMWENCKDSVNKILELHKITQNKKFTLKRFPIKEKTVKCGNDCIYINSYHREGTKAEKGGTLVKFELHSFVMGNKVIYNKIMHANDSQSHHVRGYLKSPFENRIAVIYTYDSYVLEGDWAGSYEIIGAHLTTGFKK